MKLNIPKGLNIRPSNAADKPFLEKLHNTMRQDLQLIDAEKDFVESIVEMQFKAQTQGYGEKFPNAMYFVIEKHHEAIGKATIDFGPNEIRIVDIGFLPSARGHGFGSAIIQSFQSAALQSGAPLTLVVEQCNFAAKQLYARLGFQVESISPPYEFMAWYPHPVKLMSGV
ncbi:GNAT family N-acetyltransferase [Pseudoalteromonas sp. SG45-5]|uniref:GNAT family N-acetyltransferase n=1 Tax=unclassified Pseudoalteromonas TaxID=194690 RepID=UPI0015F7E32B|nr:MULTISPECIES: GNAT family N-acetyltransferase [unclassified Pseudoalteromonas]MBB1384636.1 GNAT family N-acetyltransferase [Pseudoalteromonas sp. SG45-5]MBB1392627.1 GNAT family N-acetyltransferase [Pseudoalteromonas sp. SG44-4]MBB1449301.1 GNAT family N-acetyltransferase [Pseudoalteromonas sp. SG41-6]